MASSKTRFIAEQSILNFCARYETVFYWTFTFAENVQDKAEAEARFRPFVDLIRRRGGVLLQFWEIQSRGAWHVHLLTNLYLDVNWVRPWMMERGWGQQMKVKAVHRAAVWTPGHGWTVDDRELRRLIVYLRKYLTKSIEEGGQAQGRKKLFGGSAVCRCGTTRFKWNPRLGNAAAFLYAHGAALYREIYHEAPTWLQIGLCMRMGYEVTGWFNFDPWLYDGFV